MDANQNSNKKIYIGTEKRIKKSKTKNQQVKMTNCQATKLTLKIMEKNKNNNKTF